MLVGTQDDDIALVAGARHAVGVGSPSDDDARARLQTYLDESSGLDGIVWVSDREHRVLVRSDLP